MCTNDGDFPDCDVSLTHSEVIGLHTGNHEIVYRVVLTPTGRKKPNEKQINDVACALIKAACKGMGRE